MIRDIPHSIRQCVSRRRVRASLLAVVLCILVAVSMVAVVPVSAQFGSPETEIDVSDDFEDGNVDGWTGGSPQAVEEGFHGDWSLEVEDGFQGQTEWTSGPVLDMDEEFRLEATMRSTRPTSDFPRRIGLFEEFGEGVLLEFQSDPEATFLATSSGEDPSGVDDVIGDDFAGEWVDLIIVSDGDGTVRAKVWASGTQEPESFQLEREFEPEVGQFAIEPGAADDGRVYNLDSVSLSGQEATDPDLEIETGQLLQHDETQDYAVLYTTESNVTRDVTDSDNLTVESLDTDGVAVDETAHTLLATDNESYADRVTIRATLERDDNTSIDLTEVSVADPTVANLDVLPPVWRFGAFLGDWTVFFFILATGAGIVGTRLATSFMGLSMMELVLVMGWFGGYISTGLAMVSVFMCLFIGLNLAANIDYQVTR